jgi:hypothetical protein
MPATALLVAKYTFRGFHLENGLHFSSIVAATIRQQSSVSERLKMGLFYAQLASFVLQTACGTHGINFAVSTKFRLD